MSKVERIGPHELWLGDCREILPTLGKVDAVVTSPPYGQQRKYGLGKFDWRAVVSGGLASVAGSETQMLVNLGLIHREGHVIRYWDALIADMEAKGWRLFGWYVWDQLSGMAGDWNGRLAPSFEFVFHFNKTPRAVNKTKPTLGGRIHSGNMRNADGTADLKSHNGRPVQPVKIPDNVIRCVRETEPGPNAEHPARFPVRFALELVEPFTSRGDVVVDPFMGSGTTGVACQKLGRKFIGIEIEPKYFDIACRRIEEAMRQPDLFVASPQPAEQLSLIEAAE
jgi:DNA modification methylase